jgi:Leucine-rich repeat (LRR) protein
MKTKSHSDVTTTYIALSEFKKKTIYKKLDHIYIDINETLPEEKYVPNLKSIMFDLNVRNNIPDYKLLNDLTYYGENLPDPFKVPNLKKLRCDYVTKSYVNLEFLDCSNFYRNITLPKLETLQLRPMSLKENMCQSCHSCKCRKHDIEIFLPETPKLKSLFINDDVCIKVYPFVYNNLSFLNWYANSYDGLPKPHIVPNLKTLYCMFNKITIRIPHYENLEYLKIYLNNKDIIFPESENLNKLKILHIDRYIKNIPFYFNCNIHRTSYYDINMDHRRCLISILNKRLIYML